MRWPRISHDWRDSPWFLVFGLASCVVGAGIALNTSEYSLLTHVVGVVLVIAGAALAVYSMRRAILSDKKHRRPRQPTQHDEP